MAENMTMASNSNFKSWVSQLKQDIRIGLNSCNWHVTERMKDEVLTHISL